MRAAVVTIWFTGLSDSLHAERSLETMSRPTIHAELSITPNNKVLNEDFECADAATSVMEERRLAMRVNASVLHGAGS